MPPLFFERNTMAKEKVSTVGKKNEFNKEEFQKSRKKKK